jgi:hypothetical protein
VRLAPGLVQLLSDLGARGTGTDHEHGAVSELLGPAVVLRVQLLDTGR